MSRAERIEAALRDRSCDDFVGMSMGERAALAVLLREAADVLRDVTRTALAEPAEPEAGAEPDARAPEPHVIHARAEREPSDPNGNEWRASVLLRPTGVATWPRDVAEAMASWAAAVLIRAYLAAPAQAVEPSGERAWAPPDWRETLNDPAYQTIVGVTKHPDDAEAWVEVEIREAGGEEGGR